MLLDREGEPLQRVRIDKTARRGDWVALADISPALREAIVVSEDKRFYEHGGVDWRGAAAAAWANLWNTRTRGASTVTMQLATLIDDEGKRPGRRSVGEKAQQTVGALWLDHAWRKDQILEAYLNLVPFRGEIVGLSALSQTLFGKAPSGLNEREAALTAALVRAPNAPYAKVGRARVRASCATMRDRARRRPLREPRQLRAVDVDAHGIGVRAVVGLDALAPHFARRVAGEVHPAAGERVRSTLDAKLQRYARDTLARTLTELNSRATPRNVHDGAVIVIDNASGDVLAWVGSAGGLSNAPDVDARARRAAGRLDAQALPVCAGHRRETAHRRLAARRRPARPRGRRRPLYPAKLRSRFQGLGERAHGAGLVAERAGRAHARDGHAASLREDAASRSACRSRKPATTTASASRSAAPTSRCCR